MSICQGSGKGCGTAPTRPSRRLFACTIEYGPHFISAGGHAGSFLFDFGRVLNEPCKVVAQGVLALGDDLLMMQSLYVLLRADRDQDADGDGPDLLQKLWLSVPGFGLVNVHADPSRSRSVRLGRLAPGQQRRCLLPHRTTRHNVSRGTVTDHPQVRRSKGSSGRRKPI